MTPFNRCAAFVFLLMSWPAAQAALTIEITEGVAGALPIAVIPFGWEGASAMPEDVSAVVAEDLKRSGRFRVLPPADIVSRPTQPDKVNFSDWRMLGMDNLVIGNIKPVSGGYVIQFYVYDVLKARQIKAFSVPAQATTLRAAAHQISDIIYEALVGEPGAFSTRIAYVTVHRNAQKQTRYALVVADADGYNPREILGSPHEILSPAWSPDGTRLAYVRYERDHFPIYVQTVATGVSELVSDTPGHNGAPAWSPDGTRLALTISKRRATDNSNYDIYILDLQTKALTRFTEHWAIDTYPAWSPDGKYIVYTSDRSGRPQLYRKAVAGGKESRLTFEGNENDRASFSPNGKMLAMVHGNGGEYRIAVFELETGQLRVLSEGKLDESPSFAPNGSMVIFAATFRNAKELHAVPVSGGAARQRLYQLDSDVREPAWSPLLRTTP